mmetsp:Transcript_36455/g.77534  ORF Transcript_36455/g.77534 Transcript_36455/m.77534 type:complete len:276 (-) Transcript_36455:259-1086(-)|eukprot:CAMPEP_0206450298 /NCGR_PEP_ID=MMETSP0324_2-20121206/18639_1 /ASSEMBLY_ACC=CAM_ASM_000836 /TAXON_ID=2866 /ORGANISM="Crypthecodinium cohnii, Strain Seligo" /LENGTH=275 /DNA_ID=CAMNT_0053919915 /DNA_START=124 /DNA_END=951 /DNA_ORIENTATION=-
MAQCEEAIEDFDDDTFPAFLPDNGQDTGPFNGVEAAANLAVEPESQHGHQDEQGKGESFQHIEVAADDGQDADPERFDVDLNFEQNTHLLHGGHGQDEDHLLQEVQEESASPALKVYLEAVNAVLAKQAGKDGMKGFVDVTRRALEAWREMTEVEKSPWEEKAKDAPMQAKPRTHNKRVPADQQVLFASGSNAKGKKGKAKAKAASAKKELKPPKAPKATAKKSSAASLPAGFNFFCAEHRAQLQADKRKNTADDPDVKGDGDDAPPAKIAALGA